MKTQIIEKDFGLAKITTEILRLDNQSLHIGVFEGSQKSGKETVDIALIAAAQEYGLRGLPQRSFIGSTMTEKAQELNRLIEARYSDVLSTAKSKDKILSEIGQTVVNWIKKKIEQGPFQALDAKTIKEKESKGQSTSPLIGTGKLHDAISYKVTND